MAEYGLIGLLILAADIYAIVRILQSREDSGTKALWVLVVAILPVIGLIIWFLIGPASPRQKTV